MNGIERQGAKTLRGIGKVARIRSELIPDFFAALRLRALTLISGFLEFSGS